MDYEAFVGLVHEHLPEAKIVFISIKPSLVRFFLWEKMREANRSSKRSVDSTPVSTMSTWRRRCSERRVSAGGAFPARRLHLNDSGYHLWSDIVSRVIEQALTPPLEPIADRSGVARTGAGAVRRILTERRDSGDGAAKLHA